MDNKEIIEKKGIEDKKNILQRDLNLKEILIVVGSFMLIVAYVVVFIYPKYSEYKSSVAQLEGIKQNIVDYESQVSTLPILRNQLSSLETDIEVEKKKLSHDMEDGMFLVGLSNLINSLGVDMVSYTVDDTITYNTFYAIPTTIEVRGNYNYIRRIMSYLEEQKNTTQILDYSMETYIDEDETTTQVENQVTESRTVDSVVYWTDGGSMYHKEECSVLTLEQNANGHEVLHGTEAASGKSVACEVCKPYITTSMESQQLESTEPKATGEIVAKFKFIMYSTENPENELGTEDNSDWQPGKYNPFTSTTR